LPIWWRAPVKTFERLLRVDPFLVETAEKRVTGYLDLIDESAGSAPRQCVFGSEQGGVVEATDFCIERGEGCA
jgi:hypothetical protein